MSGDINETPWRIVSGDELIFHAHGIDSDANVLAVIEQRISNDVAIALQESLPDLAFSWRVHIRGLDHGSQLSYGAAIKLEHKLTGQYLALSDETDRVSGNRQLTLMNANSSTNDHILWTIQPGNRVRSEGEPVADGDNVLFLHFQARQAIVFESSGSQIQVGAGSIGCPFRIRRSGPWVAGNPIRVGDICVLLHRERRLWLSASADLSPLDMELTNSSPSVDLSLEATANSNTVFSDATFIAADDIQMPPLVTWYEHHINN